MLQHAGDCITLSCTPRRKRPCVSTVLPRKRQSGQKNVPEWRTGLQPVIPDGNILHGMSFSGRTRSTGALRRGFIRFLFHVARRKTILISTSFQASLASRPYSLHIAACRQPSPRHKTQNFRKIQLTSHIILLIMRLKKHQASVQGRCGCSLKQWFSCVSAAAHLALQSWMGFFYVLIFSSHGMNTVTGE